MITAVVLVSAVYLWDMNRVYARVQGKSAVLPSPYGDIEYTEGESGPPVLAIHGSGGYDNAEFAAATIPRARIGIRFTYLTTLLWVAVAIGITMLWGSNTFTRQPRQEAWA